MSTTANPTPRILTRGEDTEFNVAFFADVNQTTPLLPIDPTFPAYTIFDISGTAIQSGVGTLAQPGKYKAVFMVPKDAPLSYFQQAPQRYGDENQGTPLTNNSGRYRIEWQIVTDANQQVNFVEEFDVRDVAITQSLNRELQGLVLSGDPLRLTFRSTVVPYKTTLRFAVRGMADNPAITAIYDTTLPPANQGDIKIAKDGDSVVLYYDVPAGMTGCNTAYMALWSIQETQFSLPRTEFQIIMAVSPNILPMMTHLRMLIDKFQKRLGRLQAYEDSDLIEYLAEGLRMVNLSYPTTYFNMNATPDDMQSLVLLAAGWWALKAQALLEADLGFNFSGQSVTLSVDRSGAIDAAASSMMDIFNTQIGPAKMAYVRATQGMGTVAGRAYSYRQMYNYVYRISTVNSGSLMTTLTKIGLL